MAYSPGISVRTPGRISGLLLAGVTAISCGQLHVGTKSEVPSPLSLSLRAVLDSPKRPGYVTTDREGVRLWKLTREFYDRRKDAPAWIQDHRATPQMAALIRTLREAEDEGLDPALYHLDVIEAEHQEASRGFLTKAGFDPEEAGAIEVWLTYLYLQYASDLADGLSNLVHADSAWKIDPEPFSPLDYLEGALESNRVAESLRELTPRMPQYTALRAALADHRKRAQAGGWPDVPASLRVKPGQEGPDVATLARRLAASGDYRGRVPAEGPMRYDDELEAAVKKFQRRHGLVDDGIVGPAVVREMNVPIEARIAQIQLNLERWRWLPRDLGSRQILVNIPAYRLDVWENGAVRLSMRVVVGTPDAQTPIFHEKMTYLVFSPYWNVPPGISQSETLPAAMTDPRFLQRNNMEVLDESGNPVDPATIDPTDPAKYRFRQRPGRGNSLGLVKFMFPNQFHVYLHDTPANSLFERATRSFSHGCVRVEQPKALAEYLLRDDEAWDAAAIEEAMHAGEERTVRLREPIPVYLGYWTAEATSEGLQFSSDVYGIDSRQARRLSQHVARLKKTVPPVGQRDAEGTR